MEVPIHTYDDFQKMRDAGVLAAKTLEYISSYVAPGISTGELDDLCHAYMTKNKATPAPLEVGFPKAICTSVNHVACHGIPSYEEKLEEGDILNIDVSLKLNGWYGDTSKMFSIGKVSVKAQNLLDVTYAAFSKGIDTAQPGNTLGDVGFAIENHIKSDFNRFFVVKEYCGHGIGKKLHQAPAVLSYGKPKHGLILQEGMFFTIEPIINAGTNQTVLSKFDNWTVTTKDKSLSAQYEHTIGITKDGNEIFTKIN